jgi:cellulose synthase (UDP-forming)
MTTLTPPPVPTLSPTGAMPVTSSIVAAAAHGPVLAGRHAPVRHTRATTFVQSLAIRQRIVVGLLTLGWAVSFIAFWYWWLQPTHLVGWFGLLLNSALLFYVAYLPSYFLVAANRLRQTNAALAVPEMRVAFAVTKAPSEPWDIARTTLLAMLDQEYPYPYDVWLCDEDPSAATVMWCEAHNVRVSSRRGVEGYHRSEWPRRTRCKEGNLAYFYDTVGYRDYDVVAQLDCDHVPARHYLAEVVRPFSDPAIGYVAAPSVCDTNTAGSWSARGRLHKEASFHGPFQMGHNDGLAPVAIGSHYAVRTQALHTIGGLGPELAEDFSTTFLLNSAGWNGAFAENAEAHGDGPLTFTATVTQEFQWSRSLMVILMRTAPQHLRRLPWRLRFRFLIALCSYPLLALTTTVGLSLPVIAAITGNPWVSVPYIEFLLRWFVVSLWLVLLIAVIKRWGLLRPRSAPVLSWENWLYTVARWPFIVHGVGAAVVQQFRREALTFRVTPKVRDGMEPLPSRLMLPFVGISVVLSVAALVGESVARPNGYVLLCLLGSLVYATVALAVPLLHAREAARAADVSFADGVRTTVAWPLGLGVAVWVPLIAATIPFPSYFAPLLWHQSILVF